MIAAVNAVLHNAKSEFLVFAVTPDVVAILRIALANEFIFGLLTLVDQLDHQVRNLVCEIDPAHKRNHRTDGFASRLAEHVIERTLEHVGFCSCSPSSSASVNSNAL